MRKLFENYDVSILNGFTPSVIQNSTHSVDGYFYSWIKYGRLEKKTLERWEMEDREMVSKGVQFDGVLVIAGKADRKLLMTSKTMETVSLLKNRRDFLKYFEVKKM